MTTVTHPTTGPATYALGAGEHEIERLDRQSASLDAATRLLLRASGLASGMRVLDLGCGLGHVAAIAADLVGPEGRVVGIDNARKLLDVAASRAHHRPQLRFEEGNVLDWRDPDCEPFDAIVGRLILFHVADPVAVIRHHAAALRERGLWVALDFDLGACRTEPPTRLFTEAMSWVNGAFMRAGACPTIGSRLSLLLAGAGLTQPQGFGVQSYHGPDDPRGPALLGAVVRSLEPRIVDAGLATPEQIDIDSLERRVAAELRKANAVVMLPTLAGAWGRRG